MPESYEIYLIRHGLAEARGDAWPDDAKRPLTDEGMSRLRKAARGLVRLGIAFDVVMTSPYVRARQTAEIFAAAMDPKPHLTNADSLTPDGSYAAVLAELGKHARRKRIALVGHEPSIGELAARLMGSRHPIPFKKGAVCCIEVSTLPPSSPGNLEWLLTTKILRSIRR